jgi:hypothetical protein
MRFFLPGARDRCVRRPCTRTKRAMLIRHVGSGPRSIYTLAFTVLYLGAALMQVRQTHTHTHTHHHHHDHPTPLPLNHAGWRAAATDDRAATQVAALLVLAQTLTRRAVRRGLDPDNHVAPYLTTVADVLGTGLLIAIAAVCP